MARSGGSDLAPGFVTRVAQGFRWALGAQKPADWFGPMDPMAPLAPPQVAGRQFDYPVGYNLVTQPRAYEPVTFEQLRGLADSYDLLRLVIETRKDQIARLRWKIQPRPGSPRSAQARAAEAQEFLSMPDREHGWHAWLRMILEDMLVIDAATIYPRRSRGGQLYALEPIDGATIKRVLDDYGRTPEPPGPAYQQILKGLPAVDYRADELIYLPRNLRTFRVYGFSPVEQVVMSVNIALRRQLHQLQYYTEGSIPEALIGVPETWTPDQIGQFQSYWDTLLEGDTAQRRHARFVPATISKSYVQTKEVALKDDYDEWLARIICYAFSVSSQWAAKQMNRATAETAGEEALAEGMAPLMGWVKGMADHLLARCFAWPDLEFAWVEERAQDVLTQAQIDQIYLNLGAMTINEVRAGQGLDPVPGGDVPRIATATGLVPVEPVAPSAEAPANDTAPPAFDKFNPDQPRVPAGSAGGGQWAGGGVVDTLGGAGSDAGRGGTSSSVASGRSARMVGPIDAIRGHLPVQSAADDGDDEQKPEDFGDPMAEMRNKLYESALGRLAAIDPQNPQLNTIHKPGYIPSQADLDTVNQAIVDAQKRAAASQSDVSTANRPYANLPDPPSVRPGADFTRSQMSKIYQQNMQNNDGVIRSDKSGTELVPSQQSRPGVTPPENEAQIDHIDPKSPADPNVSPGSNSYANAQILSRKENRDKSNK